MTASASTPISWWLARVRDPDESLYAQGAPARYLRMRVEGDRAPGPDTEVEEIDDPRAWSVGQPTHLYERVVHAPPRRGGLGGSLAEYRLEAPVDARKVIGIGRNYRAHAEEMGNEVPTTPLSFFKSPTCLLASGEPIPLPAGFERIDMESELVVVIGERARHVRASDAWRVVGGYALGNDVSNRDLQRADKQWTRAKGFDGFGPCGPFIRLTPPGFEPPVADMKVCGYLNDQCVQEGSCELMIFDIPTLIAHLSEVMTLEVGDLIYTGTPAGVSALSPGDRVRVEVEGFTLGALSNPVVRATN
jgi:2-keto-4-pentenoate hydratase/2-oxohepta-3-ene-1,7-dioic acid hydratase in catechol pathway